MFFEIFKIKIKIKKSMFNKCQKQRKASIIPNPSLGHCPFIHCLSLSMKGPNETVHQDRKRQVPKREEKALDWEKVP